MEDTKIGAPEAPQAFALRPRGYFSWEPGDDICPPWWPRRPRRPPWGPGPWPFRQGEVPDDLRAADRLYNALTLVAMTFNIRDESLAGEVRKLGILSAQEAASVLGKGATVSWDGESICPPPKPWPWPGPWHHLGPQSVFQPNPQPATPVEERVPSGLAAHLIDTVAALHAYGVAAQVSHAGARRQATVALGQSVANLVEQLAERRG